MDEKNSVDTPDPAPPTDARDDRADDDRPALPQDRPPDRLMERMRRVDPTIARIYRQKHGQ